MNSNIENVLVRGPIKITNSSTVKMERIAPKLHKTPIKVNSDSF